MKSRGFVFGILLLLLFTVSAFAQCTGPQFTAVADGRTRGLFPVDINGESVSFVGSVGHSYSIEVVDANNTGTMSAFFDGPSDFRSCRTDDGAGIRHTESMDPVLPANIRRVSFTVQQGGSQTNAYGITVRTRAGTAQATVAVSDTTMYSPRWSTFSSFTTQWGFQNTTSQPVNATLTVTAAAGGAFTSAINFTIPPNGEVFKSIAAAVEPLSLLPRVTSKTAADSGGPDITTPNSMQGFAVLTHDGTPGAIVADAYFTNGSQVVTEPFRSAR